MKAEEVLFEKAEMEKKLSHIGVIISDAEELLNDMEEKIKVLKSALIYANQKVNDINTGLGDAKE